MLKHLDQIVPRPTSHGVAVGGSLQRGVLYAAYVDDPALVGGYCETADSGRLEKSAIPFSCLAARLESSSQA